MQTSPFLNQTNNMYQEISSKALKEAIEFGVYNDFYLVNDATGTLVRFAFNKPSGGRGDVIIYGDYQEAISDCYEGQSVKTWKELSLHQKVEIINQVAP